MAKSAQKVQNKLTEIFQVIPRWVTISTGSFICGVGVTLLIFSFNKKACLELPKAQTVVSSQTSYQFAYDGKTKGPSWVLEILNPGEETACPEKMKFISDPQIPVHLQTRIADYENSGFSITPLAISAGMGWSSSKFPLSVCSPMMPRVYWLKLDSYLKELSRKLNLTSVLVITGPLYIPYDGVDGKRFVTYQVIGKSNVAVPTHFFKAIFFPVYNPDGSKFTGSEIYVIPNENIEEHISLDSYRTSLGDLEQMSGIAFPENIKTYFDEHHPNRGQ